MSKTRTTRSQRGGLRLLLAGGLVLMSGGALDQLREDELVCEEAVAWLAECCPNFAPTAISCDAQSGCSTPDVSGRDYKCITALSCEQIRSASICERVVVSAQNPDAPEDVLCQ